MDIETELRPHTGFLERDVERLTREARARDPAMAEPYERQRRGSGDPPSTRAARRRAGEPA